MSVALYRETSGAGEPLVLLHGWATNLRVFDPLRAALATRFAVTAIDLPGHGRSPSVAGISASQQLALVASAVPHGANLIGWSLGGQFALQLANNAALGVRRIALIATTARFVTSPDWAHGLEPAALLQFARQLQQDASQTVSDFLDLQVRGSLDAEPVLSALKRALLGHGAASADALAAGLELLKHNDLRDLARHLSVPALVITGQYDRVTPPQAGLALSQLLSRAQLLELKRAGHAPFLSHPQQVLAALLAFLTPDSQLPHHDLQPTA